MNRLRDKVAFITGSGGGIGRASAILFSGEGSQVVVADVNQTGGNETARIINDKGGRAIFVKTDVADPESVNAAIQESIDKFGRLDIIYNNAGGSVPEDGPITEVPIEVWKNTHAVDLFGTFLCCKYGIPRLINNGGGCIILTGSISGLTGWKRSAYSAAKGGIISLTRLLAVDYAKYKIRVNCICPGLILTERSEGQIKMDPNIAEDMRPLHLLGFGKPIDVAYAALYLASDESRIVTGTVLSVDSGYTAIGRIDERDLFKGDQT